MNNTQLRKSNTLDAGYDLVATHDAIVGSSSVTKVHTGVTGDIPAGHVGLIMGRSGLAAKHGVFTLGGVVDPGFTGEIVALLSKVGQEAYPIRKGDRIAQLVCVPLSAYVPGASSARGDNGFGSTGA